MLVPTFPLSRPSLLLTTTTPSLVSSASSGHSFSLLSPHLSSCSRGYRYVCCALSVMHDHPELDLHVCFKRAYDQVLRHHHPLVVRSLVAVRLLSFTLPSAPLILLRSPFALLLPATTFACASPREQTSPSSTSPSPNGQQRSTS